MNIQKGDILFVRTSTNWMSRLIAWAMSSRWSHAALIYHVCDKDSFTLETNSKEVIINPLIDHLGNPDKELEVWRFNELTKEEINCICDYAYKMTFGLTYGYTQFISLGLKILLSKIGVTIPNFIRQGVVCNQVVNYGYNQSPIIQLRDSDAEALDTEDFYKLIKTCGAKLVLYKPVGTVTTI